LYLLLIPLFFAMIFYWMYRKFVYYQSGKHSYDFCFYLLENGQPKAGVTFTLVRKKRWATDVTSQPVAVSQVDGWVSFPEIRGVVIMPRRSMGRQNQLRARSAV
jgi:sortase A